MGKEIFNRIPFFVSLKTRKLRRFKDIHKGEHCIVMGSGPSLNNFPVDLLKKYKVIGVNATFKKYIPDYYCNIDQRLSWLDEVRRLCNKMNVPVFICWSWNYNNKTRIKYDNEIEIPWLPLQPDLKNNNNLKKRMRNVYNNPRLIETTGVSATTSVIPELAIPLAFYMGFRNVYLIGVDFTQDYGRHFYEDSEHDKFINDHQDQYEFKLTKVSDIFKIRMFSMDVIQETDKANRVFNLNPNNAIKSMAVMKVSDL